MEPGGYIPTPEERDAINPPPLPTPRRKIAGQEGSTMAAGRARYIDAMGRWGLWGVVNSSCV